ncbi:uncharacterized protein LOC132045995 [Lycium ferocissimum]|uniref:uncharacterized protein LOC132045995 n=1 Tax=Lycium ferocissimum TaxID=112874 RepID=UPI0028159164|nr:uncharacterized protein LOC132045995 [Lycium ferocissimum]
MANNVFADESEAEEDFASVIIHSRVTATTINFDQSLYHILKQEGYFRNAVDDDPHLHITNFLEVCSQHIQWGVTQEAVRLKLFKYSLAREARKWFTKLPLNSIATWEEMVKVFLRKWSLNHDFPNQILKEKFYRGLDPMTQAIANNTASRAPSIQNIGKDSQETQQTLAQLATNISLLTKRLDDREAKKVNVCEDISGMLPGIDQCHEGPYQKGPPPPIENVQYANYIAKGDAPGPNTRYWRPQQGQGAYNNNQGKFNNNQGNYNNNYGRANHGRYNNNNGNFKKRSSNPYIPLKGQSNDQGSSKLESMLEKVLASQTNTEKTLSGLSETVVSHSASIQNLEQQMRDLFREQHPVRKRGLPSDALLNSKNGGGAERTFAISTSSGKILQSADKKVINLDPINEEEEVQSNVPIVDDEVHGEEKAVDIPEIAADTRK